jgi:ATP synthase protein I
MERRSRFRLVVYLDVIKARSRIQNVASARRRIVYQAMANRARPGRAVPKLLADSGQSLNASALGLTFAFSVLVGFAIGYGLDRLFHTAPFLMLIFIVLGFASGIISIVRATRATGPRGNG